jgi:hypothetical protein
MGEGSGNLNQVILTWITFEKRDMLFNKALGIQEMTEVWIGFDSSGTSKMTYLLF